MKVFINRWILLTLVVLMVVNISVLGTIVFHVFRGGPPFPNHGMEEMGPPRMKHRLLRQLQSDLQMNDQEFGAIKPLLVDFEQTMKQNVDSMRADRKDMRNILQQPVVDTIALQGLIVKMGQRRIDMKLATVRVFLQIKQHCNDNQQETLNRIFMRLLTNEGFDRPRHHPRRMPENE